MSAEQIIEAINNELSGEDNKAVKISKILLLISGNDDSKFNRILIVLQNIVSATLDTVTVESIFSSTASPNEKVGAFINLLAKDDPEKYNKVSQILTS